MRRNFLKIICYCCIVCLFACSHEKDKADIIIYDAKVYTVNKEQIRAEAVAIKADTIMWVGSLAEVEKLKGDATEMIDADGQFLMPGFIEGHGHIHGLGASLTYLNLMSVKNWDEIVAMVAEAAKKAKPGEWIIGRGWHQEKWDSAPSKSFLGYPYHEDLDKVAPNNPVSLSHASGHSVMVNAKALELAGITSTTPNPSGGEIVKDKQGNILGVLEERAQTLVGNAYNDWLHQQTDDKRKADWAASIKLAEKECLENGITSFQDAGSSFEQVKWMQELAKENKLDIRHWLMVRENFSDLERNASVFRNLSKGNKHLTVRAVKVSLDGALGSYGAWLLAPYSDRAGWLGQNTFNIDSLKAIAEFCWRHELQLCVHAIGDRANRETLNLFGAQIHSDKKAIDHRWRIEHAQHVDPADIPVFKQWDIIASMQSVHCTSDGPFVPKRLGDKRAAEGAYMWKAFLDQGVVVTNGTDVPVENIDPLACYYSAVTRKMNNGVAFYPGQSMTREQAIYSYTMANAYAAFEEKIKGSIEVGKLADLVLLSNDLISCKEEEIKNTRVLMTMVGGKVKFNAEK